MRKKFTSIRANIVPLKLSVPVSMPGLNMDTAQLKGRVLLQIERISNSGPKSQLKNDITEILWKYFRALSVLFVLC